MIDNELNMLLAMQDDNFRAILQADEVLQQLQQEKDNKQDEYMQLMAVISKRYYICGIKVIPFTPAIWSFLFTIDNHILTGKEVREIDIAVIIYLLANGIQGISDNLHENALRFCEEKQLDFEEALKNIQRLIYLAFRALEMWPYLKQEGELNRYNLDWLTRIISYAAQVTNKTSDELIFNSSLTEVLYFAIQYCRKFDDKNAIRRRNSDEVNELMYRRTLELGRKYFEKNYLNKD